MLLIHTTAADPSQSSKAKGQWPEGLQNCPESTMLDSSYALKWAHLIFFKKKKKKTNKV